MFVFGHMGGAVAAMKSFETFKQTGGVSATRFDYRLILLFSLLPDIIDKPIALFLMPENVTSRLWAHSLLFLLGFTAALKLWAPRYAYLAIPLVVHFVLDAVWAHDTLPSLLWPVLGLSFPIYDTSVVSRWSENLHRPFIIASEMLGLVYLTFIALVKTVRIR